MTHRGDTPRGRLSPPKGEARPSRLPPRDTAPIEKHILNKRGSRDTGKRYPALIYLDNLAPSGRRSQCWALAEVALAWKRHPVKCCWRLAWQRIASSDIGRIRQILAGKFAPPTVNRCLTALRRVLRECWRAGVLSREEMERLADVRGVREDVMPGRAARTPEVRALLAACEHDASPAGARDGAAIALCYGAGLRRAEAAAIEVDDLLPGGEFAVHGKGGGLAMATLGGGEAWVSRWLAVRGTEPGPLLLQVRATGKVVFRRVGGAAVGAIVAKRAREAGVPVTAHALRRAFATELLRKGSDHLLVARALRHRDMRSVQRYDGRTDLERALAVRAAISVPAPGGQR